MYLHHFHLHLFPLKHYLFTTSFSSFHNLPRTTLTVFPSNLPSLTCPYSGEKWIQSVGRIGALRFLSEMNEQLSASENQCAFFFFASVHISICLSVYVYLSTYISVSLFTLLPVCLWRYLSAIYFIFVNKLVCSLIGVSIYLLINLSAIYLSINLSINLSAILLF